MGRSEGWNSREDSLCRYGNGEQIITERVNTCVGEAASTQVRTLVFDDEDVVARLQPLVDAYPGAQMFLLGAIGVDFPEDVLLDLQPDQLQVLSVSRSNVRLESYPMEKTINSLRGQYGIGTIQAKIVL
ncbi:hypothetical protein [Moorena producens]|uniref:hypothetical protein n=1 Tax=Moorena producens TaxID=1155739 RepID=UPI003C76E80E